MGYKMFPQVRILHIIHLHRSWGDLSPQRNLLYPALVVPPAGGEMAGGEVPSPGWGG